MFKVVRIEIFCADPNVFIVAILVRVLSSSQSTAHCCDKSVRAKVWNNAQIHSSLHKLTSHNHKLPTFSAFWFKIVKQVVVSKFPDWTVSECKQIPIFSRSLAMTQSTHSKSRLCYTAVTLWKSILVRPITYLAPFIFKYLIS